METVHIQTVIGSVFGNVTQYISGGELNAQKQELNVGGEQPRAEEAAEGEERTLPEAFTSPRAASLLERLVAASLLDERWQPLNLSNAEKGILAQYLSGELNIKNQWQTFAALWGMKPDTLRTAFNKALDKTKSLAFQDRLKGLLRE